MLDINKIIQESLETIEPQDAPLNETEENVVTENKLAGADKEEMVKLPKSDHDQEMENRGLSIADKAKKAVEDNPKTSAAIAAALAAGAGAVGLRKLLKKKNGK